MQKATQNNAGHGCHRDIMPKAGIYENANVHTNLHKPDERPDSNQIYKYEKRSQG
jgi:hypothetical protein